MGKPQTVAAKFWSEAPGHVRDVGFVVSGSDLQAPKGPRYCYGAYFPKS